jgi:UDP-N-acetyl-D-galactosamine dehydrogenase
MKKSKTVICILGLGYVGLPLAVAFAKQRWQVIGLEIRKQRVAELQKGYDRIDAFTPSELRSVDIHYTADPQEMRRANVIIVTVPTPIDASKTPDLTLLRNASRQIGHDLQKGTLVIYESTVYPGVTEELCVPIIEKGSGLRCGKDWSIGYSPERINPGDKEHRLDTVVKIISAQDSGSIKKLKDLYGSICPAGLHIAPNIKTAEAAKVIENIQRDLNIALMNELALILGRMGIQTKDVIDAASTKWNFHAYQPGLVGGHCIGVDPYYLTYRAEELGYHPSVILAGRRVNDSIAEHVATSCLKLIAQQGKRISGSRILLLGATFKEDVPDTRNSKVRDMVAVLKSYHVDPLIYDPLVPKSERHTFSGTWIENFHALKDVDAMILAAPHQIFQNISLQRYARQMTTPAIFYDVKSVFFARKRPPSMIYRTL